MNYLFRNENFPDTLNNILLSLLLSRNWENIEYKTFGLANLNSLINKRKTFEDWRKQKSLNLILV